MKLKFCGAAREVTGSCHLITLQDGYKILLDCGLYQGDNDNLEDFNERFFFKPHEIDCVILSHAHIDHCGRLPKLVKDGFTGSIYCTHPTKGLTSILLVDSAKIQEEDFKYHNKKAKRNKEPLRTDPLYTVTDVYKTMKQFVSYGYENQFHVHPAVKVLFRDAGHILGSANVSLEIKENNKTIRLSFTGDIGRPNRPILRDPVPMPAADYIICESTYGDKEHQSAPNELNTLRDIIHHVCVEKRGKLIIPAFSVGRTQELIYMMDQLSNAGELPSIPVYVDSPLAVNATDIFAAHPECFDEETFKYLMYDSNPFGFNNLNYVREIRQSKRLNSYKNASVIISASGMANAGRVKHHLFNNIENPKNGVLIVGYCTPNSPGGILRAGGKEVNLFGQTKQVNAEVFVMDSFSAHGDRKEMTEFLSNQKSVAKKIFLVHGEIERQTSFKGYLQDNGFVHTEIDIPRLGDEVEING